MNYQNKHEILNPPDPSYLFLVVELRPNSDVVLIFHVLVAQGFPLNLFVDDIFVRPNEIHETVRSLQASLWNCQILWTILICQLLALLQVVTCVILFMFRFSFLFIFLSFSFLFGYIFILIYLRNVLISNCRSLLIRMYLKWTSLITGNVAHCILF